MTLVSSTTRRTAKLVFDFFGNLVVRLLESCKFLCRVDILLSSGRVGYSTFEHKFVPLGDKVWLGHYLFHVCFVVYLKARMCFLLISQARMCNAYSYDNFTKQNGRTRDLIGDKTKYLDLVLRLNLRCKENQL